MTYTCFSPNRVRVRSDFQPLRESQVTSPPLGTFLTYEMPTHTRSSTVALTSVLASKQGIYSFFSLFFSLSISLYLCFVSISSFQIFSFFSLFLLLSFFLSFSPLRRISVSYLFQVSKFAFFLFFFFHSLSLCFSYFLSIIIFFYFPSRRM